MFTTEGKEERWRRGGKKGGGVFIGGEEARGITPRRCRKNNKSLQKRASPLTVATPTAYPNPRRAVPHGQTESGVLAVIAGARARRGSVTRQGVVLTDLESLVDCP